MLHLFLKESGLQTASTGEGPRRYVVLYPEGYRIPAEPPRDSRGGGFRPRGRSRDDRPRRSSSY